MCADGLADVGAAPGRSGAREGERRLGRSRRGLRRSAAWAAVPVPVAVAGAVAVAVVVATSSCFTFIAAAGAAERQISEDETRREAAPAAARSPAPAPEVARTPAVTPAAAPAAAHSVTYTRDIAPILWRHCGECHRAGQVAPFALTEYTDAAKRADFLVDVVTSGAMPPWKATERSLPMVGARRLAREEIQRLTAWAAAGAPEGDPADLPAAPQFSGQWRLGEPDLVVSMREPFELPADGSNLFRWFAIPIELPRDRLVAAVEFRAGNPLVVHHAVVFLDAGTTALRLDAADPVPGYESFGGPGFVPVGYLGSWSPGVEPYRLPEGMGIALPRRGTVVVQMHYQPSGKPETDCSQLGLYFHRQGRTKPVTTIPVMNTEFEIAADDPRGVVEARFVLPVDATVVALAPHMHYLGREMRLSARRPSGEEVLLIEVADWDFNWQNQYRLVEPLRLEAGTELVVEALYDNSGDNPANPHRPPVTVRYGQESGDEMCLVGVQVALDRTGDLLALMAELVRRYGEWRDGRLVVTPLE